MCLIFAKSAVELLVLTAAGANQFGRWESWALVLGLGVFALLQVSQSLIRSWSNVYWRVI